MFRFIIILVIAYFLHVHSFQLWLISRNIQRSIEKINPESIFSIWNRFQSFSSLSSSFTGGDVDPLSEFDNSRNPKWNPLDSLRNIEPEDKAMAESLVERVQQIFDLLQMNSKKGKSISSSTIITKQLFQKWEVDSKAIASDIRRSSSSKQVVLAVYKQLLAVATPLTLDPLHLSTFDIIGHAIVDNLLKLYPKNTPITELVDDLTDIHLDFIEPFRFIIDDGGSDGYSQSSTQEFLCYQYATLVRGTYTYLTQNLGSDFDMSTNTQNLRVENWVAPVYARLQRRFVRFIASNVEEKSEEILQQAFDRLLLSVSVDISPKYTLPSFDQITETNRNSPLISSSLGSKSTSTSTSTEITNVEDQAILYPPWEQADTIIKLLRNTVVGFDLLTLSLESKLLRTAQNEISSRMRPLGKILESILDKSPLSQLVLQPKELKAVEDMLNIGHSVVAATYTLWHIKHNIVGVINTEGKTEKDYLLPINLASRDTLSESIPKYLRSDIFDYTNDLIKTVKASNYLETAAVLAHAVRSTVSENLRALIIFNSDASDWPQSRDRSYQGVLAVLLYDGLVVQEFNEKIYYQNLIAMAALEESMGVREPRASCAEAFKIALRNTALILLRGDEISTRNNLLNRVSLIEDGLTMTLRLPEGSGREIRYQAFQDTINTILQEREGRGGGLKEVERVYKWIASFLGIDDRVARAFIDPLAQRKFDKAVGTILLSADLASTMQSSMGETFRDQIYSLADQVSMSRDQAVTRVSFLSGAVFESIMEAALEESRRSNFDRVEVLFRKAYNMYRHPLLIILNQERKSEDSLRKVGIRMVFARLGKTLTVELLRLVDNIRQRLLLLPLDSSSTQGGWGTSPSASTIQQKTDPELANFLGDIQQELLTEYTSASIGQGL